MNYWNYVTREEFLYLIRPWGVGAIIHPDRLDYCLYSPQIGSIDKEVYTTIYEKVGVIGFSFTKGHCFIDGNKRAGAVAMIYTAIKNGYILNIRKDHFKELLVSVADNKLSQEDLINFVRYKIVKK